MHLLSKATFAFSLCLVTATASAHFTQKDTRNTVFFGGVRWQCYGEDWQSSPPGRCLTGGEWMERAQKACEKHCYKDGSKCGVNSLSMDTTCIPAALRKPSRRSLNHSVSSARVAPVSRVLFQSGVGTGKYDRMTYAFYNGDGWFTPSKDMMIEGIEPGITACYGKCGFSVAINDEQHRGVTSTIMESSDVKSFEKVYFTHSALLKKGQRYEILQRAWTDTSVGITTTGRNAPYASGYGKLTVTGAKSETVNHTDRGMISFKLIGQTR